jgi:hypothetical protein
VVQGLEGWNVHHGLFSFRGPHPLDAFPGASGDLKGDPGLPARLVDSIVCESTVAPDQGQACIPSLGFRNDRKASITLLDRGRLNLDCHGQAQRIHHYEPFAPLDFLARVKTPGPPFSVVLTD